MRGFRLIVLLMAILAFSSCKTRKLAGRGASSQKDVAELFDKDYNAKTFNSQLQINANGVNAKGDLRIVKDKTIYLSLQAFLGIEVARLKITPDSLVAIDRFNRRYFAESFARLQELTSKGVNFYALQSLFTNKIFLNGQESLTHKDIDEFDWKNKGDETHLIPKKDSNCTFVLNGNRQLTETILTDASERFKLSWLYSDFSVIDAYDFPRQMEVNISSSKRKISSSLHFARIEFGRELNVECAIPSRYTRVNLDDILKIFSGL